MMRAAQQCCTSSEVAWRRFAPSALSAVNNAVDPDRLPIQFQSMTDRNHAESRLEAALAAAGLEDSRPALRARLKLLRQQDEGAFEQAVRSYEQETLPALAASAAPLDAWLEYARLLGELSGSGEFVAIDATGRASTWAPPYQQGTLVVHLPSDPALPALPAAVPRAPSAPQQAASGLLLEGRLG